MAIYYAKVDGRPEIRIGFAADSITRRITFLQAGNVSIVRCIRALEGTDADERALHDRFRPFWIRGSWYHPHPSLFGDVGLRELPLPRAPVNRTVWRIQPYQNPNLYPSRSAPA